jgi:prepilin-type N-terminal cleavage/methylation domain-containing protein
VTRRDPGRGQRGLTIVELLVAMSLVSILIAAAMQVAIVVLAGYKVHREAIGAQRAARGSLDLIADAVRNGSAGVPTGNVTDAAGCTPFIGLEVVNRDDAPDELSVTTAAGGVFSSLRATFDDNSSTLHVLDGSAFTAGDLVLITDFEQGHVVKITNVTEGSDDWTLGVEPTCSGVTFAYSAGALAIRARVSRFYVTDVDGTPTLMLDGDGDGPDAPEPLAEGIEDFQIAVGIDANGDGDIHDEGDSGDDWHYNAAGDVAPAAVTATPWRALRLTVVARSLVEEPGAPISSPPAAEDHPAGSPDGYRRRSISTIVEIRNLDGSP